MRAQYFLGLLAAAGIMLLASCGETTNIGTNETPERETAAHFSLEVLDDTFVGGATAGDFSLSVEDYGDDIRVNVDVENAQGLKALYFNLGYDAEQYKPLRGLPTENMGGNDVISLQYLRDRGNVQYGQVLTNFDWRPGFTGSGTVATFSFRKEPALEIRTVSIAPNDDSAPNLTFDGTDTLNWHYENIGDYNQDGLVGIADLTPLGQFFGQSTAPDPFPYESNLSAIDGDLNGNLNISDITPIGQNFGRSAAGGWNVYQSADAADIPEDSGDDNGAATLVANVPTSAATGDTATDRKAFEHVVAAPVVDVFYWVRATDGADEGPASNPVGGPIGDLPVLALTNPPGSGSGTDADPFLANITTDYVFSLTDPTDGDVSTSPTTEYFVSNPLAGEISNVDATLNIEDGFTGTFTVTAEYNNLPNRPDTTITMQVAIVGGGELFIMPDPNDTDWDTVTGDGLSFETAYILHTDTFNTDFSTEFSLVANTEADGSGDSIPVGDLEWSAEPPFIAFGLASTPGTFTVDMFSEGFIQAMDAETNLSNDLFIGVMSIPEG